MSTDTKLLVIGAGPGGYLVIPLLVSLFISTTVCAETIILKSGKKVEGQIVNKTGDSIQMNTSGVNITYYMDEIETIDGQKVETTIVKPASPSESTNITKNIEESTNNQQLAVKATEAQLSIDQLIENMQKAVEAIQDISYNQISHSKAINHPEFSGISSILYKRPCLKLERFKSGNNKESIALTKLENNKIYHDDYSPEKNEIHRMEISKEISTTIEKLTPFSDYLRIIKKLKEDKISFNIEKKAIPRGIILL